MYNGIILHTDKYCTTSQSSLNVEKKILYGNIRIMSIALSSSTLSIRKVNRMEQSRTEKIDGMNFSGKVRLEWRAPGYR